MTAPFDLADLMVLRSRDGSTPSEPLWWRPNRSGYTYSLFEAGTYSREEAERLVRGAPEKIEVFELEDAIVQWGGRQRLNPAAVARIVLYLLRIAPLTGENRAQLRWHTDPVSLAAQHNLGTGQTFFRTSESLVRCAATNGLRWIQGPTTAWHAIGRLFGLGSTSAAALCRALDMDPDDVVGRESEECPECGAGGEE